MRRPTAPLPSTRKDARIPALDARNPARTSPARPPPWPTTDNSLSDRTGSTQGIRLEDQPAEDRERQDDREAARGRPVRRGGRRGAENDGALDRPVAVDRGQPQFAADQRFGGPGRRQRRDPHQRGLAAGLDHRSRRLERPALGALDKDVGRGQRRARAQAQLHRRRGRAAHRGRGFDSQRTIPAGHRDPRPIGLDQALFDRRALGARRQREDEIGLVGHADVAACQVGHLRPQGDRLAGLAHGEGERQDDLPGVTQRFQAEDREPLRRRPGQARFGQVPRSRPVGPGRETGIARRAPVDLPALVHPEMQPGPHRRALAGRVRGRDQPDRAVFGRPPRPRRPPARAPRLERPRPLQPEPPRPDGRAGARRSHR